MVMMYKFDSNSGLLRKDFIFGAATAAFQIEGASNEDGRTDSIWDQYCRQPGKVYNGHDGSQACDHYHRWEQDLQMLADLNVDAYRLSIAWPRIMPTRGEVNAKGLQFYKQIIARLNELGIKPYVTLYHWDLPAYLEERGGWLNRETAFAFAEYADIVTRELGDSVASYATLNEPWCSAFLGYRYGVHAPGVKDDRAGFQAAHHLLLAHGLALPRMRLNAPGAQHGIVLNFAPNYPDTPADELAVAFADAENSHFFIQPLLEGKYPELIAELRPQWMPLVVDGDMEQIAQPLDFIGVNYYTRSVVKAAGDTIYKAVPQKNVEVTDFGWEVYPQGLTDLLVGMHRRYRLPPLLITENGAACDDRLIDGVVDDEQRCRYYQTHLEAVDRAMREGVDIRGYFAWSLMDNFEWAEGYSKRFGLVYVDYATQQRTLKRSAIMFQAFLASRK
jgi:beta-glucosidase